ncbi:GbsR/MarR family transcriptional regulator [Marixanthomonas ophiurae]|uniref:MarR family transcriptional regulator n=1 Tax=Marixanthomonas ophiurae TaxID=387659 RepID=A0A3E1QDL5_9FLAO|nr:MarR family transcriptional regulator [Marixanthomonas ophiurae]RFN60233.1 MarR family transcriptional regulator [Marixanthomonas ophiurae]
MEKINLTEKQKELLETYGVIQEQFGLSPASARVNALLTVIDQKELTFDEIRAILCLSKSATSNAINNLLTINYIGYRTKLGERKRYFFSRMDQWQDSFRKNLDGFREYNKVMKAILAERTPETKDYNTKIKELTQFIDYYSEEAKKIIDNWEKK